MLCDGFQKYELVALMCSSAFCQAVDDVSRFLTRQKILTQQIFSSLPASEFSVLRNPPTRVTGLVATVTIVFFLVFQIL